MTKGWKLKVHCYDGFWDRVFGAGLKHESVHGTIAECGERMREVQHRGLGMGLPSCRTHIIEVDICEEVARDG